VRTAFTRLRPVGDFSMARRLFGRVLGVIFLAAFASLAVQVHGLFGARGIMPVAEFLSAVQAQLGAAGYWQIPTLSWLNASDTSLMAQCLAGAGFSLGMIAGRLPGLCALGCWVLYLSLCSTGSPFLDFQWDALLLEAGFLAIFLLPWTPSPGWGNESRVACIARWLLWWLLFRLMFESGVVKLASGDPTWSAGTALAHHFQTQPLPLWTAWFAHQAPQWLLKSSTWLMFAIELAVPFLIFVPGWSRRIAAGAFIFLQLGILATGNYAFFNLLTIALALLLLDDGVWPQRWRARTEGAAAAEPVAPGSRWTSLAFAPVAVFIVLVTGARLLAICRIGMPMPELQALVAPLRSFNGYGLFAVMTTERPEIAVEGSNDGHVWVEYPFKWKPGDVRARPGLVAPHQPRLDWQMWFAALGEVRQNPWFLNFLVRLLQGSPEVLALLESNPFPAAPPRYVRALLYDYRYTQAGDDSGTAWWKRELEGVYCPPISLRDTQDARE